MAAYRRHLNAGETPDDACREANTRARRGQYHRNNAEINARRRATRDYAAERAAGKTRALIRLAESRADEDVREALRLGHPGPYEDLYQAARSERVTELFEALEGQTESGGQL